MTASFSPLVMATTATFVWQSADPPQVIGDFDAWGRAPLSFRRSSVGDWRTEIHLPPDTYMEYAFVRDGLRLLDPLNGNRRNDGVGHVNNWFSMPDWRPSNLTRRGKNVSEGTITQYSLSDMLRLASGTRSAWLYQPPVAEDAMPLLVVLDGQDYLRRGRLSVILDNLIAARRIRPLAALMIAHGDRARAVEYACNGATAEFIRTVAVPFARKQIGRNLGNGVGVLGASMGGLMALYLGIAMPDTFRFVLSQSGAFLDAYGYGLLRRYISMAPSPSIRIWLNAGKYEFLTDANHEAHELLTGRGYDVAYREYSGGHNYTCWRSELEHGLIGMFSPGGETTIRLSGSGPG